MLNIINILAKQQIATTFYLEKIQPQKYCPFFYNLYAKFLENHNNFRKSRFKKKHSNLNNTGKKGQNMLKIVLGISFNSFHKIKQGFLKIFIFCHFLAKMAPFLTKYGYNMAKNEYFQKSLDHFVETIKTDPQSNFEHILTFLPELFKCQCFFQNCNFLKLL